MLDCPDVLTVAEVLHDSTSGLRLFAPELDYFRQARLEMRLNETIGRRLLNVREAAQFLGLEVDTVYKKARLREGPCVKVGRALRFDVKALERFIEQHTIETID